MENNTNNNDNLFETDINNFDIDNNGEVNKNLIIDPEEEKIPYEEARIKKQEDYPQTVTDRDVEAVNERLNPDKESMKSRG